MIEYLVYKFSAGYRNFIRKFFSSCSVREEKMGVYLFPAVCRKQKSAIICSLQLAGRK